MPSEMTCVAEPAAICTARLDQVTGKRWFIMASTPRREIRPGTAMSLAQHTKDIERKLVAKTAVHELREPVQAILSFLCVLLEERTGPLSDLQRDFLATADQATRRLKRRIDDLQLTMTEHLDLTIRPEATDLLTRVSECCQELSQIAAGYGVQLELDTTKTVHRPQTWADPDRVDQIFLNLIENAIEYSTGGTKVRISVQACQPDSWSVTVRNTIGELLNEDPSTWFMPQSRGKNGIATRSNGQGLGLTAAEKLARAQGGEITARARGRTVSITVTFPAWHPAPAEHLNGHDTTFHTWGDF